MFLVSLRDLRPLTATTGGYSPQNTPRFLRALPRRRFDVGPPFVGREPAACNTEELLAGGLVRAPAGLSI